MTDSIFVYRIPIRAHNPMNGNDWIMKNLTANYDQEKWIL